MMGMSDLFLLMTEAVIVSLGGVLVYVSVRAYRRYRSKPLLGMAAGFLVILTGSLIEEFTVEVLGYHLIEAHAWENLVVGVGLLILVYSLFGVRG